MSSYLFASKFGVRPGRIQCIIDRAFRASRKSTQLVVWDTREMIHHQPGLSLVYPNTESAKDGTTLKAGRSRQRGNDALGHTVQY
jgi:hypothetical protein